MAKIIGCRKTNTLTSRNITKEYNPVTATFGDLLHKSQLFVYGQIHYSQLLWHTGIREGLLCAPYFSIESHILRIDTLKVYLLIE